MLQPEIPPILVHHLADEFQLAGAEILDLIQSAPRLKMAVRGWVAELHLQRQLEMLPEVAECVRLEDEGGPDLRVQVAGRRPIMIECKNALRGRPADGSIRVDFQRTRSSKDDPCTRFYRPTDFDVLAACLHPLYGALGVPFRANPLFGSAQAVCRASEQCDSTGCKVVIRCPGDVRPCQ